MGIPRGHRGYVLLWMPSPGKSHVAQTDISVLGRQYAFNLTVFVASVFGLCLAAPNTYNGVLVLTAFVGFGIGGNIPIDTTICLEFLPQVGSVSDHCNRALFL